MILWVPIIAMIFAGFIFFLIALSDNDPGEKFFILKFLYGEYSLAFSFWGFGIGYIIFYTSLCLFTKYMPIPEMLGGILISLEGILLIFLSFGYGIGVWNSSETYNGAKFWKYMARIYVVLKFFVSIFLGIFLFLIGLTAIYYSKT